MLLLRPVEWEGSKHPGLRQMSKLMQVLESIDGLPPCYSKEVPQNGNSYPVMGRKGGRAYPRKSAVAAPSCPGTLGLAGVKVNVYA